MSKVADAKKGYNKVMDKADLIKELVSQGVLKSPKIIKAFEKIDRADFVLPEFKPQAYEDYPLPLGHGQTISQPYTVAFMLGLLDVKPGERILEIGAGSGWQTALLAYLAAPGGKVAAIERILELVKLARRNLAKYPKLQRTSTLMQGDGSKGFLEAAPYDKIIAAASGQKIPPAWKRQLKVGGRIVAPVTDCIVVVDKLSSHEFRQTGYPGFVFVPLVKD